MSYAEHWFNQAYKAGKALSNSCIDSGDMITGHAVNFANRSNCCCPTLWNKIANTYEIAYYNARRFREDQLLCPDS